MSAEISPRLAQLRAQRAASTMDFDAEARKLQKELRDLKAKGAHALLRRAEEALKAARIPVKGSTYDSDPQFKFLTVQIRVGQREVPPGEPLLDSTQLRDLVDRVLGEGWQIRPIESEWALRIEV